MGSPDNSLPVRPIKKQRKVKKIIPLDADPRIIKKSEPSNFISITKISQEEVLIKISKLSGKYRKRKEFVLREVNQEEVMEKLEKMKLGAWKKTQHKR